MVEVAFLKAIQKSSSDKEMAKNCNESETKYDNYGFQTKFGRHIVFTPFLIIILIIIIIIKSPNEVLGTSCFCTVSYYYY